MVSFPLPLPFVNLNFTWCVVYNKEPNPTTIDVRKLKAPEAIRRTEKAIRDVLLNDGTELKVTTDGGRVKGTHLKIIKAMQE